MQKFIVPQATVLRDFTDSTYPQGSFALPRLLREREVRVLHDTGNGLCEPVSGKPVVVLERKAAAFLLGGALPDSTKDAASLLAALPPGLARRCGLVPYRAVGPEGGLLLYFRPDSVCRADGGMLDCVCAVGPQNLGRGAYEGLIGV